MKKITRYNINQSPLYKMHSLDKLIKVLGLSEIDTLERLVSKGDLNYYISKLPCGRNIEVPLPQLKRIHKRLHNLLMRIEVPEYLNSGVKGRSNVKNAKDHVGKTALLRLDIKKYYPSVTEKQIARCFVKSFSCSKKIADTLASILSINGHLPTGSPISQSLSFAINRPIFDHINIYSKSKSIVFTCYVDDLTFSGKVIPKGFCSYIMDYIKRNRNYDCHKIRTHKATTIKSVTGVIIDGDEIKVKNKHRKKIKRLLYLYDFMVSRYKLDDEKLIRYLQCLLGHLFSAGQINNGYKKKGKDIVNQRKLLGVVAMNQNTTN